MDKSRGNGNQEIFLIVHRRRLFHFLIVYTMAKKKFYAVARGRDCGIFQDWATTEKLVKGFAGARYKSFATETDAQKWLADPVYSKQVKKIEGDKTRKNSGRRAVSEPLPEDAIVVYTDGGAINNPGPGGYGVVVDADGMRREFSGGFRLTTNNRMEMTGALVALQELEKMKLSRPIHLFTDSSYLVNGITKGWARGWRARGWKKSSGEPALNADLWEKLLELLETVPVSFHWVKGHAGIELNERCDTLATTAARGKSLQIDRGYEDQE